MIASEIKALIDIFDRAREEVRKRNFNDDERRLLRAAAAHGEFHAIVTDQMPGLLVRADGTPMADEHDPASLAMAYDALLSLCSRGLVRHEDGILFRLTSKGFQKARELQR